MSEGPNSRFTRPAPRTLVAALAAMGVLPAASWIRRRITGSVRPGPGEIRLDLESTTWRLRVDLPLPAGATGWLLLVGPQYEHAQMADGACAPWAFEVPPGEPGTYRFWFLGSRHPRETAASLTRRTAKALAAGEFRVEG